jgi:hypothetical protein
MVYGIANNQLNVYIENTSTKDGAIKKAEQIAAANNIEKTNINKFMFKKIV